METPHKPPFPLSLHRPDVGSRRLRCVILEDDQMFRELLAAMLEAQDLPSKPKDLYLLGRG